MQGNSSCREQLETSQGNLYDFRPGTSTGPAPRDSVTKGNQWLLFVFCSFFFFFFLKWFYPYITIICEDSSFLFLVQILGNKHGSWWRELSTEDPGLWEGWRDHIRPGAASWGWMEVSECGLFLGKKEWNGCLVTRKIGCGVDCSMFANYFPFLPRHPVLAFPVFLRGKQNHVTVS